MGQKKLWGIVGLAKRYPRCLIDSACQRAMEDGVHSYKHVKAITERLVANALAAIDTQSQQELPPPLTQAHTLIRSTDEYGDLFTLCAAQQIPESNGATPRT